MFFFDTNKHKLPDIHAQFQGSVAVCSMPDGKLPAGKLPAKKHRTVVAWIGIHEDEPMADSEPAVNGKKPFQTRGLDQ